MYVEKRARPPSKKKKKKKKYQIQSKWKGNAHELTDEQSNPTSQKQTKIDRRTHKDR